MKRRLAVLGMGLALFFAGGCKKAQSDRDAIAETIQKHLSSLTSINMAMLDSSVGQITINGDHAQANVDFRLKQGGTSMLMTYFLERHAHDWVIVRSQPGGGEFSHPSMDKIHSNLPAEQDHPALPKLDDFFKTLPPPEAHPNSQGQPAPSSPAKTSP